MTDPKVLLVFNSKNTSAVSFVKSLHQAFHRDSITLKDAAGSSFLFDVKKHDLAHFLFSANSAPPALLKKAKGKIPTIQTLLSTPEKPKEYERILIADKIVVFTEQEKSLAEPYVQGKSIRSIPPCLDLPPVAQRQPSAKMRAEANPGDRLLIVALAEMSDQPQFMSLLYIVREFHRRGGFRLILHLANPTRETSLWKERLIHSIENEKLNSTTLMDDSAELFSWTDSSDLFLFLVRGSDPKFSFPIPALQALSLGKPLLCYNVPPVSEVIRGFQPTWVCQNTEEVVRNSMDISKEMIHLEQISTEVARYMQNFLSPERVAAQYLDLYESLMKA